MSQIEGIPFALIYAQDLERTVEFYSKNLDFKEDQNIKLKGEQVFGAIGNVKIWMGGGYKKSASTSESVRVTMMLGTCSAKLLFEKLKANQVEVLQEQPIQMEKKQYWFQFKDLDGNVLEVLGGE